MILLTLLGINFCLFQNFQVNKEGLELKYGKEEQRKKRLEEADKIEKEKRDLRKLQADGEKNKRFNPKGKGEYLDPKNIEHLGFLKSPAEGLVCEFFDEEENPINKNGSLLFAPHINEHFAKIMNDVTAIKKSPNLNINGNALEPEQQKDPYSPYLKRNNTILYGTPGTGKTEFVKELAIHLHQHFNKPLEDQKAEFGEEILKCQIEIKKLNQLPDSEEKKEKLKLVYEKYDKVRDELNIFLAKNRIPPVFQINGSKITTVTGINPNSLTISEMIVEIIKHLKHIYFGDPYSKEPYIVFFEEADEMGEQISKKPGNYLKDIKDWLSTSQDAGGLATNAQDPNSIVIAATNHFDKLEPGAVRRGRLGKDLNFDWNAKMLLDYCDSGGKTMKTDEKGNKRYFDGIKEVGWPKIQFPKNDPGWIFQGNANFVEVSKLCEKMGYSVFKDKFCPKALQIIADYEKLKKSGSEKLKKLAEKSLGEDVPTGKKMPSGRKNEDGSDKMKDELVCNWLLHFLHTFHYYSNKNQLHLYNSILDTIRYGFDNEYLMREEMQNIYLQVGRQTDQLGLVYDVMKKMFGELVGIKNFMAEAENLRQEVANLKAAMTDNEKLITKVANDSVANLRILEKQLERISSNSANSTDISNLNNRISSLESRISSLGMGGGGSGSSNSSGEITAKDYGEKINKINALNDVIKRLISAINRGSTDIQSYINEINEINGY